MDKYLKHYDEVNSLADAELDEHRQECEICQEVNSPEGFKKWQEYLARRKLVVADAAYDAAMTAYDAAKEAAETAYHEAKQAAYAVDDLASPGQPE